VSPTQYLAAEDEETSEVNKRRPALTHHPMIPVSVKPVAVGVDLVDVREVRRDLQRFGDRYLRRLFTQDEIAYCQRASDSAPHLAARIAAKEAVIKVLRVEDLQPPWTTIEVLREPAGWCTIRLSGEAARQAAERKIGECTLSLSHEGDFAIAFVVAAPAP
jgi:holo-[acyl-carrier protein] synthase